jgi:hypothetical protein
MDINSPGAALARHGKYPPDTRADGGRIRPEDCQHSVGKAMLCRNNAPHASRQICAPWGVTCFWGRTDAIH